MESMPETEHDDNLHAFGSEVDEGKKTILIYSPDLNFCFSLSTLFQDRFNVVTTTNLGMVENFAGHYSADLVIVDAIPTEKLIERLDGLKLNNQRLPIIMLYVCSPKDMHLDRAIRSHVNAVFYKPLDINALSKMIEELLRH
jgi:DNA-binding response OmpR family regulator